jgi:hypothetical protein
MIASIAATWFVGPIAAGHSQPIDLHQAADAVQLGISVLGDLEHELNQVNLGSPSQQLGEFAGRLVLRHRGRGDHGSRGGKCCVRQILAPVA